MLDVDVFESIGYWYLLVAVINSSVAFLWVNLIVRKNIRNLTIFYSSSILVYSLLLVFFGN